MSAFLRCCAVAYHSGEVTISHKIEAKLIRNLYAWQRLRTLIHERKAYITRLTIPVLVRANTHDLTLQRPFAYERMMVNFSLSHLKLSEAIDGFCVYFSF